MSGVKPPEPYGTEEAACEVEAMIAQLEDSVDVTPAEVDMFLRWLAAHAETCLAIREMARLRGGR